LEIDVLDEASVRTEITWVTDSDLLLPGEDPTTTDVRDAVQWTQVYRELIGMTAALLERSDSTLRAMTAAAAREGATTQQVLRAQREQYLARYDFWHDRAMSLQAPAQG
jgi:alkylhydroperoxidase/carboxymuconolactone decarboxylase family protein YurZ